MNPVLCRLCSEEHGFLRSRPVIELMSYGMIQFHEVMSDFILFRLLQIEVSILSQKGGKARVRQLASRIRSHRVRVESADIASPER